MSVPAQAPGTTSAHRRNTPGVTTPPADRDHASLIAAAAANPAVSDRAYKVFTLLVLVYDRGATAVEIAAAIPGETERSVSQLLGTLVTAGLLTKRLKVVGYRDGNRVRRGHYTLVGGEHA